MKTKLITLSKTLLSEFILVLFTRRTLVEHLKALFMILSITIVFLLVLTVIHKFNMDTDDNLIMQAANYILEKLQGYLSMDKILFITSTIAISFIAFCCRGWIVKNQKIRTILSNDELEKEIYNNSKAVITTLINCLSTILKVFFSLTLSLYILSKIGDQKLLTDSGLDKIENLISLTFLLLLLDFSLFIIQKFILEKIDNDINKLSHN